LVKAKAAREREHAVFEAELKRRLSLPLDQWEPVGETKGVAQGARVYIAKMFQKT